MHLLCPAVFESFKDYVAVEQLDGDNKYDAGEHGLQVRGLHTSPSDANSPKSCYPKRGTQGKKNSPCGLHNFKKKNFLKCLPI